jgi:lantibiotic modifying enzyme
VTVGGKQFAELARLAGERLCDDAIWHQGLCSWTGDEAVGPERVIHRSLGGDFYGGTAGIAWFLAHLPEGDERIARTAAAAARHALNRISNDGGLYSGTPGIACAVAAVGLRLNDSRLVEGLIEFCRTAVRGLSLNADDLIVGRAGALLGLLAQAQTLPAKEACELTEAAQALGELVVARASRQAGGLCWPGEDPSEPALCGMGHGASGIALALAELSHVTGQAQMREAALDALRYERSWFSRESGNWPDLREYNRSAASTGEQPASEISWCHGASGAAISRLRIFALTGDRHALAEAGAAVDRATVGILGVLKSLGAEPDSYTFNFSQCHGVASVTEMHLIAADITGDAEHVEHARMIARVALCALLKVQGGKGDPPALLDALTGGVPEGSAPGLMLGTAGIGAALLRLGDPAAMPSPLAPWSWSKWPVPAGEVAISRPQ